MDLFGAWHPVRRGINVPVSIKLQESSELGFRLNHSGSKFVIVSGRQFEKIHKIASRTSALQKIIVMDKIETKYQYIIEDVRSRGRASKEIKSNRLMKDEP